MGNLLHFMIVVNCPLTEKYMSHFRPDNIFSALLIGEHCKQDVFDVVRTLCQNRS